MGVEGNLSRNLVTVTTDLIMEIFSKLPSKSIARFRCLSKLWASTLSSPYFTELFLTQSATRPRLLFAVERNDNVWCLYSCPQPQSQNSSLFSVVTAEFLMSLPEGRLLTISAPILGLIYCYNFKGYDSPMLCNPSSRFVLRLPQFTAAAKSYFGYDPIGKQFNILAISYPLYSHQVMRYYLLKLGSGKLFWRNIECPVEHYPLEYYTSINGILYYIGIFKRYDYRIQFRKIACFDLNSEEFKFIDLPCWHEVDDVLVNFKGKLGGINKKWVKLSEERFNLELTLWVLEDIEKQEWSKHVYVLSSSLSLCLWNTKPPQFSIVGVTATGEVVLSLRHITNPLYIYFFNLEKNILRTLEIKGFQGFKLHSIHHGCVDYVEGLKDRIWN